MFWGMPMYGMASLKVQTYNLLYATAPHSYEEALETAVKTAEMIFGDSKLKEYPRRKILIEDKRWKIYFISQKDFDQGETGQNRGIEIQLGMNTGKIRYWNLRE